jgi:diguanylate cyclase
LPDRVEVRRLGSRAQQWWNDADHFDWTTEFLTQRGLLRSAQIVMAIVAASAALAALSFLGGVQWSTWAVVVVGVGGVAFTMAMTGFWLTRWPTRRQSQVSIIVGAGFIAAWSIVQPTTALAILACSATAVTGGYIAFFHNTRLLAFNFAVAVATATAATWRLGSETNAATAVAAFWLIWFVNLTVPLTIGAMARAMGTYAARSHADPLTGLLNRRGFADAVRHQLTGAPDTERHLSLMMVDLDNFKLVNDTQGHAAGDRSLQAVAELLRQHCPHTAAICRAGGEEFLVAVRTGRAGAESLARRLCLAIAELPHVTASIGTSCTSLDSIGRRDPAAMLDELIATADAAMYVAKRRGGNQVQSG